LSLILNNLRFNGLVTIAFLKRLYNLHINKGFFSNALFLN